jgi:hypothetical protein
MLPGSWDYKPPLNTDWPTAIEQETAAQATATNWDEPAPGQITEEDLISILSGSSPIPGLTPPLSQTPKPTKDKGKGKARGPKEEPQASDPEALQDPYSTEPFPAPLERPPTPEIYHHHRPGLHGNNLDYEEFFRSLENQQRIDALLTKFRDQPHKRDVIHAYASTQEVYRDLEQALNDREAFRTCLQETQD